MPDATSFIASFADPLGSFKVGRSQILLSTQCSCHQEGCPEDQCPHRQEQAPVPPESDGSDNPIHHRSRERQQDYVSSRWGRGARLHQNPPRIIATTRLSVSSKPGDHQDVESSVRDAPVVGARIRRDALYEPTPRMSGRMTGVHTFSDGLDWGPVPWASAMDQPHDPGEQKQRERQNPGAEEHTPGYVPPFAPRDLLGRPSETRDAGPLPPWGFLVAHRRLGSYPAQSW